MASLPEFAIRFYTQLFAEFPELLVSAVFLTRPGSNRCTFFDIANGGFATEIDADLEYVIVWDTEGVGESGPWDDPVPHAMVWVREIVAARHTVGGTVDP